MLFDFLSLLQNPDFVSGSSLSLTVHVLNGSITPMGVTKFYITLSVLFCRGVTYENVGFNKSAWEKYPYHSPERGWGAKRAVDGCHPGWFGNYCNKACAVGTYGFECRETCGNCRDISQCLNTNGTCLGGCKDGFHGYLCKSPCNTGSYGIDCKEKCGNCLDVYKCSLSNGTCLTGCVAGYHGNLCKTPCTLGSYGLECRGTCGNCHMCSNTNGSCLTACDAGYLGEMCKTPCGRGFFGKNCTHTCIETCNGCKNVNGLCDSGCLLGWKGYFCSKLYGCSPKGYFGSNCSIPCPDVNCQECHMESGICHVCKQGYKGQRCETDFINNIKFYSLLGAFCLSLTVIGILIGYNIMIRKRQLTQHQPYDHQESCDVNLPDVSRGYVNCEELRDMQMYDTAQ
uniref:EGF-like domain-containing protein n=1 Tax=Magallana gigas TaxID=29159 RepID=A0A8W8NYT5_MAGGI